MIVVDKSAPPLPTCPQPALPFRVSQPFLRARRLGRVEISDQVITEAKALNLDSFNADYTEFAMAAGAEHNRWCSLALKNRTGDGSSSESFEYEGGAQWTEHADRHPAIKALAQRLFPEDGNLSIRLFAAPPGSGIRPHRDYLDFIRRFVRIHVALLTNSSCINGEGAIAFHADPGDVIELDGNPMHWAVNHGGENRIHLVADYRPGMAIEQCFVADAMVTNTLPLAHVDRPELPPEVAALVATCARHATVGSLESLMNRVDLLFTRYRIEGTPYDLVAPYLPDTSAMRQAFLLRRRHFLGL